MSKPNPTWISEWNPEDKEFWESKGKVIARRNLIWSIVAEHLGFSIWLIWSIVATKLPQAGFHFTTDQLFQLVALPGLIGSLMRFPYTFAVATFGGRNWTIFSASVLFIPVIALAYFVTQPDTPFWEMLLVSATAGLGGGNFASSMANISFFYPDRMKGWALGLNAAGGNIGVSSVQLLAPILMGLGIINLYQAAPVGGIYLQNAGLMWVVPLVIALFGAIFFMNNLTSARSTFKDQLAIVGRKHTWIMSYIYIGTFGSFIGYSAAFPLLIKTQFPAVTVAVAFLGPSPAPDERNCHPVDQAVSQGLIDLGKAASPLRDCGNGRRTVGRARKMPAEAMAEVHCGGVACPVHRHDLVRTESNKHGLE